MTAQQHPGDDDADNAVADTSFSDSSAKRTRSQNQQQLTAALVDVERLGGEPSAAAQQEQNKLQQRCAELEREGGVMRQLMEESESADQVYNKKTLELTQQNEISSQLLAREREDWKAKEVALTGEVSKAKQELQAAGQQQAAQQASQVAHAEQELAALKSQAERVASSHQEERSRLAEAVATEAAARKAAQSRAAEEAEQKAAEKTRADRLQVGLTRQVSD